jgi:hypothetical protein
MCPTCGRVCNTTIGFYVPHTAFLSVTLYHVKTLLYGKVCVSVQNNQDLPHLPHLCQF